MNSLRICVLFTHPSVDRITIALAFMCVDRTCMSAQPFLIKPRFIRSVVSHETIDWIHLTKRVMDSQPIHVGSGQTYAKL